MNIEEEEEIEKAPKIALDLERKRNNEELSHQISKINFSKYLPNSEVMLKIILRLRIMQRGPLKLIVKNYHDW